MLKFELNACFTITKDGVLRTAYCPPYTIIARALAHCQAWYVSGRIRDARGVLHAYARRQRYGVCRARAFPSQHVSLLPNLLRVCHEPPSNVEYPYPYELGNGQWHMTRRGKRLEDIVSHHSESQDVEVVHDFSHSEPNVMRLQHAPP